MAFFLIVLSLFVSADGFGYFSHPSTYLRSTPTPSHVVGLKIQIRIKNRFVKIFDRFVKIF